MQSLKGVSRVFFARNKTKTSAVVIIALLALSVVIAILPTVNAQVIALPNRKEYAYLSVMPRTVGMDQPLLVNLWINPPMATPHLWSQAEIRWENITITFTRPDGSKDTFMPQEPGGILQPGQSERMGAIWFHYYPTQVGEWSVQFSFPGQTFYDTYGGQKYSVYCEPCTSQIVKFTVQEDIVQIGFLPVPLPIGYWERPISAANREWSQISGDWLQPQYNGLNTYSGWSFNPYSTAPNSPHIVWKQQVSQGGLVGGDWGGLSYGAGGGAPPVIMNGKVYYNDAAGGTFSCVNLRTGQLLYRANGTITLGHALRAESAAVATPAQSETVSPVGSLWELGTTQWKLYDPLTGVLLRTISNVPQATLRPRWTAGSEIVYIAHYWGYNTTLPWKFAGNCLIKWNLTKVTGNNWLTGVEYNVSVRQPDGWGPGDGRTTVSINCIVGNIGVVAGHNCEDRMLGYDLETGTLLWDKKVDFVVMAFMGYGPYDYGPLVQFDSSLTLHAFDVRTGKEMWTTKVGEYPWGSMLRRFYTAYGNIYTSTYDGHVYAIDAATGKIKWVDEGTGNNTETPFGTWAPYTGPVIADGKLYWGTSEHSPTQPRMRGNYMFCMDSYTGKFLWTLASPISPSAIADGYLLGTSEYDGTMYCIGKGKTETTISIQNDVISAGSNALIKGTVMDLSPAQPGTPAISDGEMSAWMEYLHLQNATMINSPPTPAGVPVQLTAVGSDGSVIDVGTVTSNSAGLYAYTWKSPAEGQYTVYATFAGSESYWSSYAATALSVGPAPETGTTQLETVAPDNTSTVIGVGLAVIIAVAIVGLLLYRKKQ